MMDALFLKIKTDVSAFIKANVPPKYVYHNLDHTLYVLDKVVHIGIKEKIDDENMFLLKVAAMYHDAGFVYGAADHEINSCSIATDQLPLYGIGLGHISKICDLIMCTKLPQNPKNILEAIISDADLYYLSTPQAESISQKLFIEWMGTIPGFTTEKWEDLVKTFLTSHHYHTPYCLRYREKLKTKYDKLL